MAQRHELHSLLKEALGGDQVHFQPPENVKLEFPCIIYNRDAEHVDYADNRRYRDKTRYLVRVVAREPDSDVNDRVKALPLCSFDRFYTADNLNHDVYSIYF